MDDRWIFSIRFIIENMGTHNDQCERKYHEKS